MHHLTCGFNSLLHSINLILFPVLLVHFILRISPHHSHNLHSHHLSLPLPSTSDIKLISFTNPFLHSHSYFFQTDFTDLNLYWIKGALFVCFSFWLRVPDSAVYSDFESTLNSSIVSYRIISYSYAMVSRITKNLLFVCDWSNECAKDHAWAKPGNKQHFNVMLGHLVVLIQGIDVWALQPVASCNIWTTKTLH